MKKIAIVGAGGLGQEVYCLWREMLCHRKTEYNFIGFFDDDETLSRRCYGNVIGNVEDLNQIDYPLEVALAIGTPKVLQTIKNKIINSKISFPSIVHPSVRILDRENIALGEGNILSLGVILSCNVNIGKFNIFNTRVTLGHDVRVGDYNVFSPGVQISGKVDIGTSNFWGFNSGILQGKKVGNDNTIGAGSILMTTIKNAGLYIGNPGIKVKLT